MQKIMGLRVDWINLAQDRAKILAAVNTVTNLRCP